MPKTEIDNLSARLALADAVLEAVKNSGLLAKPRRSTARARKAAATRARNARAAAKAAGTAPASKKRGAKPAKPLANVPTEPAAA